MGGVISCKEQIESGPAAHRTEIDHPVLPVFMVSQEGGSKMLDRVDLCGIHHRLVVWACHADIKSGDDRAVHMILSGDVDAWFQADMVNGKTCDLFHNRCFLSLVSVLFIIAVRRVKYKECCLQMVCKCIRQQVYLCLQEWISPVCFNGHKEGL